MTSSRRHVLTLIACCVPLLNIGTTCRGDDALPASIFEVRPPHVRVSEPSESAATPHGGQSFSPFESPPAIPPQNDVQLTIADPLSIVYPASGGSSVSGGTAVVDRVRINGSQVELDVFNFFNAFGPFGQTIVGPRENSLFLGQLPAGVYDVNVENWYLPYALAAGFNPETFEPPANAITPTGSLFALPIAPDDPPIVVTSTFQFAVLAVPESKTIVLVAFAVMSTFGFIRVGRPAPRTSRERS